MSIFSDVKENVTIEQAAQYLGLRPVKPPKNGEGRYKCPVCDTKDTDPLCIGYADQAFTCYGTGKKPHGDLIALVAHCKSVSQTEAAKLLARYFLAAPASTATKPKATAEGEARSDVGAVVDVTPLELLGIDASLAKHLNIREEEGRIWFDVRDAEGVMHGSLAIATREDVPLVAFVAETEETVKAEPSSLAQLWRVVKGGA